MLKFFAVSLLVAVELAAFPAYSQQISTKDAVVSECALVASDENAKKPSHEFAGRCLNATGIYLTALRAEGLPADTFGSNISALVVDLALLLRDHCVLNSEIAQAIAMASAASTDVDQKAQIKLISVTVSECDFGVTAAIRAPFDTDGTSNRASGRPASFS